MEKPQTAVEWLEERMKISLGEEFKPLVGFFVLAKETEREQHGRTWDSAIKAHEDRGRVLSRSLTDFDEYQIK